MSVSVIIPCFNSSDTIERAVKSVMDQTYQGLLEILIIDDASTDNTSAKLIDVSEKFQNVIILKNEKNMGPGYSRNKGIAASKFDYIAFLDADDFWLPNKLKSQIEFMEDSNYDFTYHDYYILSLPPKGDVRQSINHVISPELAELPGFYYLRNYGMCLTSVVRKKSILNMKFSEDREISTEDYFFFLGLIRSGVIGVRVPMPLGVYTVSGSGRSNNKLIQAISVLKVNLNYSTYSLRAIFYFAKYICIQFMGKISRRSLDIKNADDLNYIYELMRFSGIKNKMKADLL